MTLSQHVHTLGRGPGRARSLTRDEAHDAMRQMLDDTCAPEAIGALLMLLRMKGETAEEIAGFSEAAQGAAPDLPEVDLDWPSYAAGRTRGAPWFLLSARLVAEAGHRVLLHGWNGQDSAVRAGLATAGIGIARNATEARHLLESQRIAYMPLEAFHPRLFHLLDLRRVLGLRSCINTICRMLNPGRATASVQGVFHPSYRLLQADAATLLGWQSLSVIKGGGGEFERNPAKDIDAFGLRDAVPWRSTCSALRDEARRLADPTMQSLVQAPLGPFEADIITGTTALALNTLGVPDAEATAHRLWRAHRDPQAA